MVEQDVYDRIKTLADGRVYPTIPTENTQLPFLVYTITATEPQTHTLGASGLTRANIDIDCWAINLETTLEILSQAKTTLHLYRGGNIQGCFLSTQSTTQEEFGFHGQQSYSAWVEIGANYATTEALAQNSIFPPRLTIIEDWTTSFEVYGTPDELAVFKYVDYRNKPHRTTKKPGWVNPYTSHKGKRWEQVWELPINATSWELPTNYADSIRPHDNRPFELNPSLNLRTTWKPKSFRIGAKYGNIWLLSSEAIRYLPNKINNTYGIGFGTPR